MLFKIFEEMKSFRLGSNDHSTHVSSEQSLCGHKIGWTLYQDIGDDSSYQPPFYRKIGGGSIARERVPLRP